jgi:probable F420-dependent oxidoreductase
MPRAYVAADLPRYSGGRFVLGLGSQTRPHVEKRFSRPWSRPAARMREFVLALRAIWSAWEDGGPLEHRGAFYTHTLMTPAFTPPASPHGPPRVFLAAVGPHMTEVAGEVADGLLAHPFLTERYLREVTLPALGRGRSRGGRDGSTGRAPFELGLSAFVALDDADVEAVRRQISFYGSTPAYRPVLEHHDHGELQPQLRERTRSDDWASLVELVDDDLFDLVAIRGTPTECGAELARRTVGLVDRVAPNAPYRSDPAVWREVLKAFHLAADDIDEASPPLEDEDGS